MKPDLDFQEIDELLGPLKEKLAEIENPEAKKMIQDNLEDIEVKRKDFANAEGDDKAQRDIIKAAKDEVDNVNKQIKQSMKEER